MINADLTLGSISLLKVISNVAFAATPVASREGTWLDTIKAGVEDAVGVGVEVAEADGVAVEVALGNGLAAGGLFTCPQPPI